MLVIVWTDDEGHVVAKTPPGGMTAEQAQSDRSVVPQDRPSFIVDNSTLPTEPLPAWRLDSKGVITAEPVAPSEVTPEQKIIERLGMTPEELKAALDAV